MAFTRTLVASAVALAMSAGTASAAFSEIFIDDYSDGFTDLTTRMSGMFSTAGIPNVLGTVREIRYNLVDNPANTRINILAGDSDFPGLAVGNGPRMTSVVSAVYNAGGAGLNFDATAQDVNGVTFNFLSVDLPTDFTITLNDGAGRSSTINLAIAAPVSGALLFSAFTTDAGFDYSDIDGVTLVFNDETRLADRDFIFDYIAFGVDVPAPAGAGLLALTGLAACIRRRK